MKQKVNADPNNKHAVTVYQQTRGIDLMLF